MVCYSRPKEPNCSITIPNHLYEVIKALLSKKYTCFHPIYAHDGLIQAYLYISFLLNYVLFYINTASEINSHHLTRFCYYHRLYFDPLNTLLYIFDLISQLGKFWIYLLYSLWSRHTFEMTDTLLIHRRYRFSIK